MELIDNGDSPKDLEVASSVKGLAGVASEVEEPDGKGDAPEDLEEAGGGECVAGMVTPLPTRALRLAPMLFACFQQSSQKIYRHLLVW